ncbi:MAG TPA: ABC transporter substrate-binding protein [Methylomirabilota bacterium]|nr:ABC transporter substrate-binding protein [Methylomirabilota bacterium]
MTLTRRDIVLGIVAALTVPREASAARVQRITVYAGRQVSDGLVEALSERGWVEGRNITMDWQGVEGSEVRIGEHLAKTPADVLVAGGAHRIRAAMRVTTTTPIIAIDLEADPVANGFIKTLARPGGNVTGIWMDLPEIAGKQIQFLREVLPSLNRLGVVWDDRIGQPQFAELQAVCRRAGINLSPAAVRLTTEIDDALKRLVAERPQAIVLLTAPVVFQGLRRIAELAALSRLPSISPFSPYPGWGGLMAYGPDFPAMWRQLGGYVDRVLRGARPGDLPVERPSKFSLIVNLKTAKTLGLTLPRSLVLRADQVIDQ